MPDSSYITIVYYNYKLTRFIKICHLKGISILVRQNKLEDIASGIVIVYYSL